GGGRRCLRARAADLDRGRVPRLEGAREPTRFALVALRSGRSLEAAWPARASGASRAAGRLRRLSGPDDLGHGVLGGVPERRRPEQGDDERGGGEGDCEALQCILKLAPCRAVAYPIANVTRTVAWISCLPGSIGASSARVLFASAASKYGIGSAPLSVIAVTLPSWTPPASASARAFARALPTAPRSALACSSS